jgi:hypothetical protein
MHRRELAPKYTLDRGLMLSPVGDWMGSPDHKFEIKAGSASYKPYHFAGATAGRHVAMFCERSLR